MNLAPVPVPDPDTAPFWEATAGGTLALCRCVDTGEWFHPPVERSRRTGGPVRFEPVSGRGTVFSYVVVRQQLVPGPQVPYVIAVVELEEQAGLRMTGVLHADPAEVAIGMPVRAELTAADQAGTRAVEFVPA